MAAIISSSSKSSIPIMEIIKFGINIVEILGARYKFDARDAITKLNFAEIYYSTQDKKPVIACEPSDEPTHEPTSPPAEISMNSPEKMLIEDIKAQYEKKQKRNIWENSKFEYISKLENDDVGRIGEQYIQHICDYGQIDCNIDGTKTKTQGIGDGIINGKSVEIKTARMGSGSAKTFQHELGEVPWLADYMMFIDISPETFFLTIFPNFTEEQYKSGCKCAPYFPTKKFTWRKNAGAFKFDTSYNLNTTQCAVDNCHTLKCDSRDEMVKFIKRIIA